MSTWLNQGFTIYDAMARGFSTWDLLISGWGRATGGEYGQSFPPVGVKGLPSVYGISIGAQSQVDRCFVAYDIDKTIPNNITWDIAHRLSVATPLMFPIAGKQQIVQNGSPLNPQTGGSTLTIYPTGTTSVAGQVGMDASIYQDTFVDGTGTTQNLNLNALLHLVLYLKPVTGVVNTARAPLTLTASATVGAIVPAELKLFTFPTFGRRFIEVQVEVNNLGAPWDFRFEGINSVSNMTVLGARTLNTVTGVASGASVLYRLENAYQDLVSAYISGVGIGSVYRYTIKAVD